MKKITNLGIFTLLLVSSLTIMVGTVIAPSLTGIVDNLNFGFSPGWLITLPSLGVVVFAPIVGKLLHKKGSFIMLCLGLVPYAFLGFAGAYITNDYILMLDRFLLGAATVAVQVSVTSFIADFFTGEKRMKLIAWQGMSIELGGVIFLSIGGILGQWHWQYPFFLYLIAIICLLLVVKSLPKAVKKDIAVATQDKKEDKLAIKIIFYASLLSMVLFFVSFVTLPIYLPKSIGFTESYTGYFMAFISLVAIVTASQMPRVVKKIGDGCVVALGFLLFMLGYITLAIVGSLPLLILSAIFIGAGFGFTIPLLNHMMIEASATKNLGKNLGLYSMGVFGGQFLSTFIEYISANYAIVYGVASLLALVIGILLYYAFKKIEVHSK
ncbi:MFS transporter [Cellulophaga omnivescoria]|uniref:MFS transporter n=1 Tax=Cellulophaga omnivescoria TaxID=1888890 RepID=UPI0022F0F0DC|nr:MFS transporter [Cellulophaga omnivescoria]WBU88110.1 MFS transporter [Cellulophaga omnivescoria]